MTNRTDVVIAGAGMAGLAAALACVQAGLRVRVLEKRSTVGGQAAISAGAIWAPPTFEAIRDYVPDGDPSLQRLLVERLPDDLRWLQDSGLALSEVEPLAGFGCGRVMLGGESGRHAAFMDAMADRVKGHGGRVDTGLALDGATRTADGAWLLDLSDGSRQACTALVIATGGYQGSPHWLARFLGADRAAALVLRGLPESAGDGLRVALSLGAATGGDMASFYGHSMPDCPLSLASLQPLTPYFARHGVLVNRDGERFVDECAARLEEVNPQEGCRQAGGKYHLIFDRRIYEQHGIDQGVISAVPSIDRLARLQELGAPVVSAPSLEVLAERLVEDGLPAARLLATLAAYNEACDRGTAEHLRPARVRSAVALRVAPFYAMRCVPGITNTCGGIRVDAQARVLAASGAPIEGLHAAGTDAGGVFGRHYAGFLGWALVSGRRAGLSASQGLRQGGSR